MVLTKLDALIAEVEPYTPSGSLLRKALADNGVADETASYDSASDRITIAKSAIAVLRKLIVLSSDSLGKSSQGYNTENLKSRIVAICNDCGLDASNFVDVPEIADGSKLW